MEKQHADRNQSRDYMLDFFRACALVYVVCVIHPVYWLFNGTEPVMSVLLFEMPVIFFVSGAAASMAGYGSRSLKDVFFQRVRRIVVPYIIMVVLSLLMVELYCMLFDRPRVDMPVRDFVRCICTALFLPGVPYSYQLWFVPVYFVISVSTPIQQYICSRIFRNAYAYIAVCVLLWGIGYVINVSGLVTYSIGQFISQVSLYNVFYVTGYFLYKKIRRRTMVICALLSIVALVFITHGDVSGMQEHKFNQDFIFLVFGITALLCISCVVSYSKLTNVTGVWFKYGLDRWNKYGYTIYLWQNWGFVLLLWMADVAGVLAQNHPIALCWEIPVIYILSWSMSWILVPLENYIMRLIYRTQN